MNAEAVLLGRRYDFVLRATDFPAADAANAQIGLFHVVILPDFPRLAPTFGFLLP